VSHPQRGEDRIYSASMNGTLFQQAKSYGRCSGESAEYASTVTPTIFGVSALAMLIICFMMINEKKNLDLFPFKRP